MDVVDSSALLLLARVGRLDLIESTFESVRTTTQVQTEVLVEGKRGTAVLDDYLDGVAITEMPDGAEAMAAMEGVAVADASVILLAADDETTLLANDRGLIEVARSHGVECWWVTTLLLRCTKAGDLTADEAIDLLYNLVNEGMNLHPKVYTQVQQKLRDLGE